MLAKLVREAAQAPESFQVPAVRALILYPMNALVNDQLGRLRMLLGDPRVTTRFQASAGRPPRFARYTSRTFYPGVRSRKKDQLRLKPIEDFYILLLDQAGDESSPGHDNAVALIDMLKARGKWPAKPDLQAWYGAKNARWQNAAGDFLRAITLPEDPELLTRHEVLQAPPDVLITNYSMLEYMLMRPLERPVFDMTRSWLEANPDEKFLLIIDEAHLYRGAAGAEVALLLRRLRSRLGITPDRLQVIATSASFASPEYARVFAAQLSGKDVADFRTVRGRLAERSPSGTGSITDAEALAAVPLGRFYEGEDDEARTGAVRGFLEFRGVTPGPEASTGELLVAALGSYPPMGLLVNETMQQARPVSELGALLFPGADAALADRAASALVALGSSARSLAWGGRAAAVPGSRVLPGPSRAVGVPRPGLPRGRPRGAPGAGSCRQAVRAAAGGLRVRCPRLRVVHLPPLWLGLRPRVHQRPRQPRVPVARARRAVPVGRRVDRRAFRARPASGGAVIRRHRPG